MFLLNFKLSSFFKKVILGFLFLSFIVVNFKANASNQYASSEPLVNVEKHTSNQCSTFPATKVGVMLLLDKRGVEFTIDSDGDLRYEMNTDNWHGYVIFGEIGKPSKLWNLQVRTQFNTRPGFYQKLVMFANNWNADQKVPKIAMKVPNKMVLSINYPVQFGFNPKEFEVNVFNQLNRSAVKIAKQIEPMIMLIEDGTSQVH